MIASGHMPFAGAGEFTCAGFGDLRQWTVDPQNAPVNSLGPPRGIRVWYWLNAFSFAVDLAAFGQIGDTCHR
jgi:hypothetical protein